MTICSTSLVLFTFHISLFSSIIMPFIYLFYCLSLLFIVHRNSPFRHSSPFAFAFTSLHSRELSEESDMAGSKWAFMKQPRSSFVLKIFISYFESYSFILLWGPKTRLFPFHNPHFSNLWIFWPISLRYSLDNWAIWGWKNLDFIISAKSSNFQWIL